MKDELKLSCFTILVKDKEKKILDRGTGFFINNCGNFLSAGHVFKYKDCKFSAIFEGQAIEYPITEIYKEYVIQDEVTSTSYKDLYIGSISIKSIAFFSLMTEIVPARSKVSMAGFNKLPPDGLIVDIDDLFDEDLIGEDSVYFNTYQTEITDEKRYKTNRSNGSFYLMDNIYSIKSVGSKIRGISGGPLLLGNSCIGIINNTFECVNSKYIANKLSYLNIPYTTI
ncbi:hypothetical protein [Pedobacter sp. MR22-3]|uniref:hypothetical protein n=1 Tax=Pedobacter sp. MR22-3 TaxID=2994552 RepID=UPI00224572E9|nr:hypothetical protein [Pedobacter sp. MR22-3]MCX2583990.1 hypothetical protein [Pedobacter sp. MR22-3]